MSDIYTFGGIRFVQFFYKRIDLVLAIISSVWYK